MTGTLRIERDREYERRSRDPQHCATRAGDIAIAAGADISEFETNRADDQSMQAYEAATSAAHGALADLADYVRKLAGDFAACDALITRCMHSADYREGRTAFMEKRKPRFRGL